MKKTKIIKIPNTTIAVGVIALIIHLSSFFRKGIPYEGLNLNVFFTVLFSSLVKILIPFLVIYILLIFINSGSKKFFKPKSIQKIWDFSIHLFIYTLALTAGISLLVKFAITYPSIIGWFSNLVIYSMIGLIAIFLVRNINKKATFREASQPILWILGFFYFLNFPNKTFLIIFLIFAVIIFSIKIIKNYKKRKNEIQK